MLIGQAVHFSDVVYASDVLLHGGPNKPKALISHRDDGVAMVGLHFAPSKGKVLLENWISGQSCLLLGTLRCG